MNGVKYILITLLFLPIFSVSSGENVQPGFITNPAFVTQIPADFSCPSTNEVEFNDDFDFDISNGPAELLLKKITGFAGTFKKVIHYTNPIKKLTFSVFLLDLPPPSH